MSPRLTLDADVAPDCSPLLLLHIVTEAATLSVELTLAEVRDLLAQMPAKLREAVAALDTLALARATGNDR